MWFLAANHSGCAAKPILVLTLLTWVRNQKLFPKEGGYCFRNTQELVVIITNYCLLVHYWWVSPMLNTIFSIFSSFFRMFDFTVEILSSCYEKMIGLKYQCLATISGSQLSLWIHDRCHHQPVVGSPVHSQLLSTLPGGWTGVATSAKSHIQYVVIVI